MQNAPIRKSDGSWARNNEEKAIRFADHLECTFQPNVREEYEEEGKQQEKINAKKRTIWPDTLREV